MYDKHHDQQNCPAKKATDASRDMLAVEYEANRDRANHLRYPVHEVIQGPGTDVKKCIIVLIKLCFRFPSDNLHLDTKKYAHARRKTN